MRGGRARTKSLLLLFSGPAGEAGTPAAPSAPTAGGAYAEAPPHVRRWIAYGCELLRGTAQARARHGLGTVRGVISDRISGSTAVKISRRPAVVRSRAQFSGGWSGTAQMTRHVVTRRLVAYTTGTLAGTLCGACPPWQGVSPGEDEDLLLLLVGAAHGR